nr:MAG TPA: General control protein GCN4 and CLUSTER, BENDABLE REGION, CONTRACTILE.6A [Caudoviricetes sp.]
MIKCFELSSEQIRIRDILNDKNFLEIEIFAISDANPNRNKSHFTLESMQKGLESFNDKPILGFFNKQGDFESHNGRVAYDPEEQVDYWDNSNGEQILGFIRQTDRKEIVERDGLHWICCTAMIYTQYNYKQVKRLLKDRKKKVSVEIAVLDSEMVDGIEYIKEFDLKGITILGSRNGIQVKEGIEGAGLSILEVFDAARFSGQKQTIIQAYSQLEDDDKNKEDGNLAIEDFEKALKVNKSKEAMSDTSWGDVDKAELRKRVVEASNFKQIADDVFLDLREGWEEGEVTKLKYPVMEIKGDELVYNRGALGSAKAYAEKNGEEEVLKKLKAIYEHLDLDFEAKFDCECDEFCDLYEDDVPCDGDDDCDDPDDCDDCSLEKHAEEVIVEEPKEEPIEEPVVVVEKVYTEEEFNAACDELKMKCQEAESKCAEAEGKYSELEAKCCEYESKCADYEKRCAEYEKKCAELEDRCANYEVTAGKLKLEMDECIAKMQDYEEIKKARDEMVEKFAVMKVNEQKDYISNVCAKMKFTEEEIKPIGEKCERREYENIEAIDRDIAYLSFQKTKATLFSEKTEMFSVNIVEEPKQKSGRKEMTLRERLKDNIKK